MTLKKFNIFGISAGWPFWLVDAVVAVAVGWAVYYNYFVTGAGLGIGLPLLLITLSTFLAITGIFYLARWAFSKTIDGQTSQGTFVIIDKRVKENIKNGKLVRAITDAFYVAIVNQISVELATVKKFWYNWYNSSDGIEYRCKNSILGLSSEQVQTRLDNIFNGAFIVINPDPFIQQSSLGPMAWLTGKVMGVQQGNQACIVWNPDINPGMTNLCDGARHETGHMALEAIGVPSGNNGELHHEIFKNSKYGV